MKIRFYNLVHNLKKNQIGKQLPTTYFILDGELRDSVNIMNPEIIIDLSVASNIEAHTPDHDEELAADLIAQLRREPFNTVNYVFIPLLNRYYFITNIVLLRKNLVSFKLHVDVLMFSEFIKKQTAFITRSESRYFPLLADERRIVTNKQEVTYLKPTELSAPAGVMYLKFDPYFTNDNQEYIETSVYNIMCVAHTSGVDQGYIETKIGDIRPTIPSNNLPKIHQGLFAPVNAKPYVLNLTETAHLLNNVANVHPPHADSVGVMYAYPFNFKSFYNDASWGNLQTTFSLGTGNIWEGHAVHKINTLTSGYLLHTRFTLSEDYATDFNDLEPYSQYELYIPYYGYTTINYNALRGHTLAIYYVINYQIGTATVILYDETRDSVINSYQTQLGIEIPKNLSNIKEVTDRHNANNLSLSLGLVSSALSVIVGIASENPVAVAGGVIAGSKSIADYNKNERSNIYKEQIQFNGSTAPLFAPQEIYIRKTKKLIQFGLTPDFLEQNGGICNSLLPLNNVNLSGYLEISDIPNINYALISVIPTDDEVTEIISLLKSGVRI